MSDGQKSSLIQKLVAVYEEVDHVEKRGQNSGVGVGYKYVKASDLAHAIRNALSKMGVYAEINFTIERSYLIGRGVGDNGKEKNPMQAVDVRSTVVFHESDSTATITSSGLGSGADMGDKAIFKAQTGALKYALRNAFLVPDATDPEADETTDEKTSDTKQTTTVAKGALAATTKAAQAPKAEIPASLPKTIGLASPPLEGTTVRLPVVEAKTSTEMPTEEQLVEFRKQFKQLGDDLAAAGLKAGRGLPINRKVRAFLLANTSTDDPAKITLAQWDKFFEFVAATKNSEGSIKSLVILINEIIEANGGAK